MDNDRKELQQTLYKFVEGTLVHGDYNISLETLTDDVIGIGMGEQGYYSGKKQLSELFASVFKGSEGASQQTSIRYGEVGIQIPSEYTASITAEVHMTTLINGETMTSSLMQMASARKEEGKWLFFMLAAVPINLSEDGIEAYPLAFAEEALDKLKAEMQTDSFELMNNSFSGGILCTYIKENYPLCFANDSFIEMLGYEREEFEEVFKDNTVKIGYSDDKVVMAELSREAEEAGDDYSSRARWMKKDGSILWVKFRTRKTEDEYGNEIFLSVVIDVSKDVELEIKLKEQNQLIVDSLNYAHRIQKHLLASDHILEKAFTDYSVIWKPRDVVGGDIYWSRSYKEGSLLCVCDCTGHGIPGALLTMLASAAIDSATESISCNDTARIMMEVDRRFAMAFGLDEKENESVSKRRIRDGCDIAVIFTAKDGTVTLSSGHIHVFVCNGDEVKRIRGQNISIGEGKIQSLDEIKTTVIPADKRNKFFVASDGLFDQIGGEKRRPIGFRPYSDVFLNTYNESLSVTTKRLWECFEDYRGDELRRDDVEIVAFQP